MEPNKNTSVFLKDTCKLGQVVKIQGGYSFQSSAFTNRGIPIIRISNIDNDQIDLKNSVVFYEEIKNLDENFVAKDSDLLIAMSGATTGKAGVYKNTNLAYINQRVGKFIVTKPDKVIYKYLSYWVSSNHFTKQLSKYLASGAQPNISPTNIEDMDIVLPDTKTQERIIRTLDAISNNISNLEALISKQEAIKKTTVKLLLQPKEDWIIKTIGEICDFYAAGSKSSYITENGQYYIVDMGAISSDGLLIATKQTNYACDFLKKNDLVMPKDDIGGGQIIGKTIVIEEDDKYILGDHVYKLTTTINAKFLSYLINSPDINKYMRKMATGSAQLGLSKHSIAKCKVCFPAQETEQQRIAAQLSEIDAHIDNLKQQLAKQRAIKQGLMDYFFGN